MAEIKKMIKWCDFCIIKIPCLCSITTATFHLQPRLTACHNFTKNITKLHPLNLVMLQEFFDPSLTQHIYADTTFQKPLNVSTPAFRIYKHEMHDVLADDTVSHLNLHKMVNQAKNDEMIFKSLSEPLLEGQIRINSSWPDFNATLILISGGFIVLSVIAIMWLFIRVRKLTITLYILQQGQKAHALTSTLPSFIYKHLTSSTETANQTVFEITLKWEHAIFLLSIIILAVSITVLLKIYQNHHSHLPWLCAEISGVDGCLLLPIIRLPLCPSKCHIQVPTFISDLCISGSWFSPKLNVNWPNFIIINQNTSHAIPVPKTFELSIINGHKLKKMLKWPFFIYIHVAYNGFLTKIDPPEKHIM